MINKLKKILCTLTCLIISFNAFTQTTSPKRGFCGDPLNQADLEVIKNASWYYNWGQEPIESIKSTMKDYLDYCPMIWDEDYSKDNLRRYLSEHPEIDYLLGFNEPNFIEQANIGPREAALLWPEIEKIADEFDLKLVSPALNFSYSGGAVIEEGIEYTDPFQYLDDFFDALPDTSRVDYIAIHGYFDNTGALPWYIGLYEKYDLPLWLTEFNHSAGYIDEISQQNFLVEALDYLENEPSVFRYAWFLARSPQTNTNLFKNDTSGELTNLGLIFANMSSYDSEFFHSTEQTIEAEHYVNMQGIHMIAVEDTSGIIAVHDFDDGDWLDYNLEVDESRDYFIECRITSIWESSFSLYDGSTYIGTFDVPITGGLENWKTIAFHVNLNEGNHKLRIRIDSGGWKLNWFKVSRNLTVSSDDEIPINKGKVQIYPNPASSSEVLKLRTTLENYSCRITNIQGISMAHHVNLTKDTIIDISSLEAGYYILTIDCNSYHFSKTIVVE